MRNRKRWLVLGVLGLIGVALIVCVGLTVWAVQLIRPDALPGFNDTVAIIYIEGEIITGRPAGAGSSGAVYSEKIIEYLREIQKNNSVKAVVLRIDSPGGSVVASRDIYDEIVATQKKGKPVVASFSELAASGGYYIAAPADKIFSHPDALTGSIGVISVIPSLEGLADKVGVKMIIIKSGAHKDESYGFRDLTPEERAIWQSLIDEAYGEFVDVVARGRKMEATQVRQLADGRIYTGNQAKQLGLVDEIGNLEAAVDAAAKLGKIAGTPRKIEYRYVPGFFESLGVLFTPAWSQELNSVINTRRAGKMMYLFTAP